MSREPNPSRFRKQLLRWYKAGARDLPWRHTKDPYRIWISEIMLQQTQVDTVIPYYQKWLKRFPTLKSIVEVPLSEVLKFWAGLGYYRRARMLHQAAKLISGNHAGRIPQDAEVLLKLPGIGRYTAGAIASIAYNRKVPVLDGNVIRVLTRLAALREDIGSPKTIRRLWRMSESLLPGQDPGDFNQALMELGATVCIPENPRCGLCPVTAFCKAGRLGRQTDFPVNSRKEKTIKKRSVALILRRNGCVAVQRQPREGRWGGLWTFPFWEDKKEMIRDIAVGTRSPRPQQGRTNHRGGVTPPLQHRMTLHHGFTKYRIRLDVYELNKAFNRRGGPCPSTQDAQDGERQSNRARPKSSVIRLTWGAREGRPYINTKYTCLDGLKWIKIKNLVRLPFPSPHQKIAEELLANHGSRSAA